jgi:ketosteroid isomerase-like protein
MDSSALLQELRDRRAIEDALVTYAHALDARAYGRLADCLAPDVRVKFGAAPWLDGIPAAEAFCRAILDRLDASQHRIGTVDVTLAGDGARSTTYICAEHVKRGLRGGDRYTVGGCYRDVWRRTPAGWRIAQRELVVSWGDGNPGVIGAPAAAPRRKPAKRPKRRRAGARASRR